MKTAKEIYDNGLQNCYIGKDIKEKASITNFQIITDLLEPDEDVIMGFNGFLSEKEKGNKMGAPYSFAVTKKRILMGAKIGLSRDSQTLLWDNVEHLAIEQHKPFTNFGRITIETLAKPYRISMSLKTAEIVNNKLNAIFMNVKSLADKPAEPVVADVAEEILKFKSLLDMGVITQEEFDAKKRQLLDI